MGLWELMKKRLTVVNLFFLILVCALVGGYGLANLSNLQEVVKSAEITYENWKRNSVEIET